MGVRDGEKYIKLENLESFEVGGFEGQVALGGGYNPHLMPLAPQNLSSTLTL